MSVDIDENGAVTANGRVVDYPMAYGWCLDSPETITELVLDTQAFATVIAEAEHAGPEEQATAVHRAFEAGVPRSPGAGWRAAHPREPVPPQEPAREDAGAGEAVRGDAPSGSAQPSQATPAAPPRSDPGR